MFRLEVYYADEAWPRQVEVIDQSAGVFVALTDLLTLPGLDRIVVAATHSPLFAVNSDGETIAAG
jgi:hypothetical protein